MSDKLGKRYFEAHVTMTGDLAQLKKMTEQLRWKFSAIDGDANLGVGLKMYATRQFNSRIGTEAVVQSLITAAAMLQHSGATILRRKVELVMFDDRISTVAACNGACAECIMET